MGSIVGASASSPFIRDAGAGDAAAIGRVRHASWQAAYEGLMPADYLAGLSVDGFELAARRMLAQQAAGRLTVLVVEVGGLVSGFAAVGRTRDADAVDGVDGARLTAGPVGELQALYLHPDVWRRGIGRRLQEAALDRLRIAGFTEATLWVLATNTASKAFYERTGWRSDGKLADFEAGAEVLDEERFRRAL